MRTTLGYSAQETDLPAQRLGCRHRRGTDMSAVCASFQTDGRHISAPFSLRHDFESLSKPENLAFFKQTFPGNEGYAHDNLFLYIYLSKPPQPIPKSFAGVPVLFVPTVTGPIPLPPRLVIPRGYFVPGRQGQIAVHLNYRNKTDFVWEPLFIEIQAHFQSLAIPITEVIYFGHFVYIVLEDPRTEMGKLPCRAASLTCMYMFEHEMQRPTTLQARPRIKDAGHNAAVDDSNYEILQPGIKVSSDFVPNSEASFSTTLGARVYDQDGNEYITVAAHGFFNEVGAGVFHPSREDGRLIGHMVKCADNTDIGLLSLRSSETYVNETFSSTAGGPSSLITGLGTPRQFDIVAIDSPYTGYLEGQVMATSRRRIPNEDGVEEQDWVTNNWIFENQGSSELLPDSVCGSIAYDTSNYKILSFFQYQIKDGPWKGWHVGTSSTELIKRGYT